MGDQGAPLARLAYGVQATAHLFLGLSHHCGAHPRDTLAAQQLHQAGDLLGTRVGGVDVEAAVTVDLDVGQPRGHPELRATVRGHDGSHPAAPHFYPGKPPAFDKPPADFDGLVCAHGARSTP